MIFPLAPLPLVFFLPHLLESETKPIFNVFLCYVSTFNILYLSYQQHSSIHLHSKAIQAKPSLMKRHKLIKVVVVEEKYVCNVCAGKRERKETKRKEMMSENPFLLSSAMSSSPSLLFPRRLVQSCGLVFIHFFVLVHRTHTYSHRYAFISIF